MAAEDQTSSGKPPVQFVRLQNIAWMNCKLCVDYGYDQNLQTFKYTKEADEILKDQTSMIDLSQLDGIQPGDLVRPHVKAVQARSADPLKFSRNNQAATYQFRGTLFDAWLDRM
jgi:hypothetical protein